MEDYSYEDEACLFIFSLKIRKLNYKVNGAYILKFCNLIGLI